MVTKILKAARHVGVPSLGLSYPLNPRRLGEPSARGAVQRLAPHAKVLPMPAIVPGTSQCNSSNLLLRNSNGSDATHVRDSCSWKLVAITSRRSIDSSCVPPLLTFIRCICGAEFCYVCGMKWKTCTCEFWDESRLIARRSHGSQGTADLSNQHVATVSSSTTNTSMRTTITPGRFRWKCEARYLSGQSCSDSLDANKTCD